MSKPSTLTLKKAEQKKVISIFCGTKKVKGIKNPKTIADIVGVPRRQVMVVLEDNKLTSYSPGSYA